MEINITWNICRVCLVEEEIKQTEGIGEPMRNIFKEDKMLPKQIYECSGITMKDNDHLPQKICKKCLTMIKYAVHFRKTCRASDTYLQSILQRTKSASDLFKPQQLQLETPSEDVSNDILEMEPEALNIAMEFKPLISQGSYLDETVTKYRKKSESTEINSNSDDLIEHDDEDINEIDINNIVEQEDLLNYSESRVNQITGAKEDSSLDKVINDDNEGNEDNETYTYSKESPHKVDDFEEEEFVSIEFKESADNRKSNKKDDFDGENQIEVYEQQYDGSESLSLTDMEENQAQVSSTVATKEYDLIEVHDDSRLSIETSDMQTEYIVDEYLIDDNSNTSLHNSSLVVINPKISKKNTKGKKTSKGTSDSQVWICDLCGNHFTNRQVLNIHMKIHRQEKKHECELCSKRFITACNLQAHMRIHTGEKPFECQYCGRRFSDRSSHIRHERIHTNVKPFQCKQCGKAFSLATTLKKHLTVHTGERSYRCDICAKSFKLPHQLQAHNKTSAHKAQLYIVR